jgi:hypothetical protein
MVWLCLARHPDSTIEFNRARTQRAEDRGYSTHPLSRGTFWVAVSSINGMVGMAGGSQQMFSSLSGPLGISEHRFGSGSRFLPLNEIDAFSLRASAGQR